MRTLPAIERVKGIHPGVILEREIKKRNLKGIAFSKAIGEHFQTINAITKGRRGMNPKLSIKLGAYFDIDREYFMLLQASYEVSTVFASEQNETHPLERKFRTSIFWDTKLENIDVDKHKRSIIQRVLERGNAKEVRALIKHYSLEVIRDEVSAIGESYVPQYAKNVDKYISH